MYIFLLPLLVVRTGAYRRTILERTEWKDLRVELWTWNSGKANLQQEADRLAATNADILVTCQTEATADISTFLKEEWTLLAHGEHWGAAGGAINAQIANAFLRTPLDGFNYVIDASKAYSKLWRQDVGPRTTLRRQSSGYFNDLLHAKAQVIATDYKGKGGISIELVFPSYQDQKDLRLDFVCAHLDSEMNEKRHFGVAELLSRVRSDDVDVASNIRSEACGKKGDLRQPCALFDRELPSCNVTEGSHLPPPPDAVFLFGDLNYRLKKTGLEDMSQAWLLDWTKREALGHNDHLVNGADPLVKEPESGGFGFTCNKPFALYPPTYKRKGGQVHWEKTIEFSKFHNTALDDALHATMGLEIEITNSTGGKLDIDALLDPKKILEAPAFPITVKTKPFEACSKVGKALSQCGQVKQPECKEWVLAFAKQCYRKKEDKALMDKYGLERWAVKKDDLQLGWLDRFCFREIKRDSTLKVSLLGEAGWMDYPGIKDKQNGSDHMPVAATFLVSSTTCNCPKVKRNMMISGCQVADSGVLRFGELSVVTCKSGYALDTRQKSEIIKCGQYGKTEVQGDGHLTFDALKCVKVCEAPYQAPSSIPSSPFSPPEGLVLEGDEVRAKCRPRNGGQMPLSLGESRMRCGSDGLFRPIGKPPICAPTCKNNFDKAYFLLEERRAAANEILSEYATEVNSKLAWQPMKVAEGGFFKYSCRNECITMGNRKQTCMDGLLDGHGQQMFCGCLLELRLTKMVFDDSWMKDEVQKIKLQLYKGPLTEDQLHHVRSSKGYLSQQKFHLEDVGKEQLILSAIPSKELEIHLTVCSRHGKRSLFSSCGIFAETSADSLNLVPFIEGGSSHTGNFDLPLAVKHQEGAELKASRVTLSFSFNVGGYRSKT
ncbi:Potassium voltage-gated channel subfamily H member 7 [Durusdinium trenchii]|uniref:Potassium voltage-gated channel subfamily H member 7 n=1 Tax=Durusdinium trenchii TaxID=1381693 RepID=A0ABP0QEJ4_9DINO